MSGIWAIFRREVAGLLLSPIAIVVGLVFLVLEGLAFSNIVSGLADPRVAAPYGSALRAQFGGTMLFWAIVFGAVAAITMSLIAGEKQTGQWELTTTTRVSGFSIVFGKWLAAWTFFAVLFLPTCAYLAVLSFFAAQAEAIAWGAIASAYLGVLVIGGLLTALGLCASAWSPNQPASAIISFAGCMGFLLLGEAVAGGLGEGFETDSVNAQVFSLRHTLQDCADGLVRADSLMCFTVIAIGFVLLARASVRPHPSGTKRLFLIVKRATLPVLVFAAGVEIGYLGRHFDLSVDVTKNKRHTITEQTDSLLSKITKTLDVTVYEPEQIEFEPLFRSVKATLQRMSERQANLRVRAVEPLVEKENIESLAQDFALSPVDLAKGGAVVVEYLGNKQVVDVLGLAEFGYDQLGKGAVRILRVEAAIADAIRKVMRGKVGTVCLPQKSSPQVNARFSDLLGRLERHGVTVLPVDSMENLALCNAVVMLGLQQFSEQQAIALHQFLQSGGSLFAAIPDAAMSLGNSAAVTDANADGAVAETDLNLSAVLESYGISVQKLVVIDPNNEIEGSLAWMTSSGYGEHPIVLGFRNHRASVWALPWAIKGGIPLVYASSSGWAEGDIAGALRGDTVEPSADELLMPRAVAVATEKNKTRIVVFGSAQSISNAATSKGMTGAAELAAASITWLLRSNDGSPAMQEAGFRTPEQLRLLMTRGQKRLVFASVVILIPLLFAAMLLLVFRRWLR